jgi:ribosomal protein S18 acetylase RimI-like enzyme
MPASLPATDEFIVRCERVRSSSYVKRADAQGALEQTPEPAGSARFGDAVAWYAGKRARVHLLDQANLRHLAAIEAWAAERQLAPTFDVLPIVSCRPVAIALGERDYRLVAWQPLLFRNLSGPIDPSGNTFSIEEIGREPHAEFRQTYLRGYGFAEHELQTWGRVLEARWEAEGARRFLARLGERPVAAATLVVMDGIARLANSATLPEFRNRGAQTALIRARLQRLAAEGVEFVTSDARQDGSSLRNLSRAGFVISAQITQWQYASNRPSA